MTLLDHYMGEAEPAYSTASQCNGRGLGAV
jgi:hypothetical protein